MLDDAADEEQRHFAEAGILVASEQRGLAVPDRKVGVHAAAVVVLDRLGHESRSLAIGMGYLVHDVLVHLHAIGRFDQLAERQAQFVLGAGHFVVVLVARQAHFQHGGNHFGAQINGAVHRGAGEITTLGARTVGHVALLILAAAVGRQFDIVEVEEAFVVTQAETHIVEHEELGFRADIDGIADATGLQIGFAALGGGARIAAIKLAGRRFDDVADQDHHRGGREGIDIGRIQIRHQDHVAFVDRLPAGNRGTVKHETVVEHVFVDDARHHGQMLPLALGIGEAQIDPLDLLLLDHRQNVSSRGHWVFPRCFLGVGNSAGKIRSRRCLARRCGCARPFRWGTRKSCRRRYGRCVLRW